MVMAQSAPSSAFSPTVLAVTHWKAGSQWIRALLEDLGGDRIVPSNVSNPQFSSIELRPGAVYPALYVTRQALEAKVLPENSRVFVVIRDLRDTLVSLYFSDLATHFPSEEHAETREHLASLTREDGFIWVLENKLTRSAAIQSSFAGSAWSVWKFEDLVKGPIERFRQLLVEHCGFALTDGAIASLVARHSFNVLAEGREPGTEDRGSHYRKGEIGDWNNHFTPRITEAFKRKYAGVLQLTGYEEDDNWYPDTRAPKPIAEDPFAEIERLEQERQTLLLSLARLTHNAHEIRVDSAKRLDVIEELVRHNNWLRSEWLALATQVGAIANALRPPVEP